MEISITICTLFNLIALSVGVPLGLFFLFWKKEAHIKILGVFFVLFAFNKLREILIAEAVFDDFPGLLFLPFFVSTLVPVLYLSMRAVNERLSFRQVFWALSPLLAEFTILTALFFLPTDEKVALHENSLFKISAHSMALAANLVFLCLIYFRFIKKEKGGGMVKHRGTGRHVFQLAWKIAFLYTIYHGLCSPVFDDLASPVFKWAPALAAFVAVLLVFYSTVETLLMLRPKLKRAIKIKAPEIQAILDLEKKTESPEMQEFRKVIYFMQKEQPHLDAELTLPALSVKMLIGQRKLSWLINNHTGMNFSRFINAYRVTEALELLADPERDDCSVTGIGFESGFNSKATFFAAFKDFTGMSPAEFRKLKTKGKATDKSGIGFNQKTH